MKAIATRLIAAGTLAAAMCCCPLEAAAQAVQLPTFNFFTVNTTVVVPDGGDVLLGSVNRASSGRIERGIPGLPGRPFTNVATGSSVGASSVRVSAHIHDFDALERALLGNSVAATSTGRSPLAPAQQLAVKNGPAPLVSVAAIRAQVAAEDAAREREAADSLARGRKVLAEGKAGVAKIFFQTAARQSKGDVRKQALIALSEIERAKSATRVAGR